MSERARWSSRFGLVLAMVGSAVGLGSFLQFPRQVVEHGPGAFLLPYLAGLALVGIPLVWIEWAIGRRGGLAGQGSTPGMFDTLWRHPAAKYLGVLGLFVPVAVFTSACYVESWALAWTWFSASGATSGLNADAMREFFASYTDLGDAGGTHAAWVPFLFLLPTVAVNAWVVSRGLRAGVEWLARIAVPVLFLFALVLAVGVLAQPGQAVASDPTGGITGPFTGLALLYGTDWGALARPGTWFAGVAHALVAVSAGMGTLQAYASYLRKGDDVVRSGLTTSLLGPATQVGLGGSITIAALVTYAGVAGAVTIARGSGYEMGFVAMPLALNHLAGGATPGMLAGFLWFGLLFLAGLTSTVALLLPAATFMEERFSWDRGQSVVSLGVLTAMLGMVHILLYTRGFLDEWSYWTLVPGVLLLAVVEAVLFMWVMGPTRAWHELHEGATLRIPRAWRGVMTYVTPLALLGLLGWWMVQEAGAVVTMQGRLPDEVPVRWLARAALAAILGAQLALIKAAWRRRPVVRARLAE